MPRIYSFRKLRPPTHGFCIPLQYCTVLHWTALCSPHSPARGPWRWSSREAEKKACTARIGSRNTPRGIKKAMAGQGRPISDIKIDIVHGGRSAPESPAGRQGGREAVERCRRRGGCGVSWGLLWRGRGGQRTAGRAAPRCTALHHAVRSRAGNWQETEARTAHMGTLGTLGTLGTRGTRGTTRRDETVRTTGRQAGRQRRHGGGDDTIR